MKIEHELFKIWFEENQNTVFFEGSLRLWDPTEYTRIKKMLLEIYDLEISDLTMDFLNLNFLNSSGISTLVKFIFEAKKINKHKICIIGNKEILWQKKSFENLTKIWPEIELVMK